MGREVRRVISNWEHPKDVRGNYIPLFDTNVIACQAEWDLGAQKWAEGLVDDWHGGWKVRDVGIGSETYSEYAGERPRAEDHMPQCTEVEKTHLMMYETVTEGTPISPVFSTPEELAHWLTDNEASACGDQVASYEGWLRVAQGGYAPSMVMDSAGMRSGVDLEAGSER